MKIVVLCGTNRPGANSRVVARHLERLHADAGRDVTLLDLADLPPAIFDPASYAEKPADFAPFNDAILAADGIHLVTPEYNGGMPGVLKYFIDMLQFPESFEARPVAFVGVAAGMWGALRPVEQLQQIFGYRNAHIFPGRVFMPGIGSAITDGALTDEKLQERLAGQASGFADFVARLRG